MFGVFRLWLTRITLGSPHGEYRNADRAFVRHLFRNPSVERGWGFFVCAPVGEGGPEAALSAMGGRCVYACEIDAEAAAVYQRNWGVKALADITHDANDTTMKVPAHDVLAAGFPCQPFSTAGNRLGFEDERTAPIGAMVNYIKTKLPKTFVF